jgi:pterin-4a-carbinolamine dehydratase
MANGEHTYSDKQVAERLATLPGWRFEGGSIRRAYGTDGWPTTLMLVNVLGYIAEAADHHPDLAVSYRRVVVTLSTHTAGGVTDKDLEVARRFDEVALWRPTGGALKGTAADFVRSEPGRG